MNGYFSQEDLEKIGFKSLGKNVLISEKCTIHGAERMEIGNNVRVDDFSTLVGDILIGNYVHISPYCGIHGTGGGKIIMEDFTALSVGVIAYAASDDYGGDYMTNSMVPEKYRKVDAADIYVKKHSVVGIRSILLPGAYLEEGTAVGAMSLVTIRTQPWGIYAGIPCVRKKDRGKKALDLEKEFMQSVREEI